MINIKTIEEEVKKEMETKLAAGLVHKVGIDAEEALNRRRYMQDLLKWMDDVEVEITRTVRDNSTTIPDDTNRRYAQLVYIELKAIRHEIKRIIEDEKMNEQVGV